MAAGKGASKGVFVGTAYVKLMPSMRGFANNVKAELANSGVTDKMGKAISKSLDNVDTGGMRDKFKGLGDNLSSSLRGVGNVAKSVFSHIGDLASKAVSTVTNVTKGLAAAGAAATAAIGKSALDAYSNNEQLVGGIETLYGAKGAKSVEEYAQMVGKSVDEVADDYAKLESAQALMIENANNAYATAGMSANEYMENVTGFSAALISSLGGDTEAAAKAADTAMADIADNANRMGTDMASITQTYQSLARGNFGMLDNLKLGFGGTKEEAERMLAEAEKISGVHYDISNFADITKAIHVIQDQMGITGATAEEAASTIEGSTKMAKAAWHNWVTGLGQDNANMEQLTTNLSTSVEAMLNNVAPRLGTIFQSLATALPDLISKVMANAPKIITDVIPSLIQSITGVVGGITAAIPQILQAFIPALAQGLADGFNQLSDLMESDGGNFADSLTTLVTDAFNTLMPAVARFVPNLYTAGIDILLSLITGIADALANNVDVIIDGIKTFIDNMIAILPTFITNIVEVAVSVINAVAEQLPIVLPKIINTIMDVLITNMPTITQALITSVASVIEAIAQALPTFVPQLVQLLLGIVDALLDNIDIIIDAAFDLTEGLLEGLINALPIIIDKLPDLITRVIDAVIENLPIIIDGVITLFEMLVEHLPELIVALVDAVPDIINALLDGLIKLLPRVFEGGIKLITSLIEGITSYISKLPEVAQHIMTAITDTLAELPGKLLEIGGELVQGLIDGITSGIGSVGDAIGSLGDSAVQGLKDLLGIHSPSRVMRELGRNTVAGYYEGINDSKGDVLDLMSGLTGDLRAGVDVNGSTDANRLTADYAARISNAANNGASREELLAILSEFKDAINGIAIYMDSTQVSRLTANARDKVDGARQNYANRGVVAA